MAPNRFDQPLGGYGYEAGDAIMENQRTISDLARDADVPISTVRYYERSGLVYPDTRTEANYRIYGDGAVVRIRFIRSAQAAGFTLSDIKLLLELKDGNKARCSEVQPVVEARLEDVDARIKELQEVSGILHSFRDICRRTNADDSCEVIDKLDP